MPDCPHCHRYYFGNPDQCPNCYYDFKTRRVVVPQHIQKEQKKQQEEPQNCHHMADWEHESRFSTASGKDLPYVVMQVTLKEKVLGTGSANLTDLEEVINAQVAKGYRLHTMSTSNSDSKGFAGGDRIQATLVFERLDLR